MLKNRLCYLIVLLGTLLFFVCYNGYLSLYVLWAVLVLPLVSLLVSLPGMLGIKLELSVKTASARKGRSIPVSLTVSNRLPFVSGRVRTVLKVCNLLTGESQTERFSFTAGPRPLVLSHKLRSPFCGQVVLELSKTRACDYMGLFSLPVRLSGPRKQSVFFYPVVYSPELTVEHSILPDGEDDGYSQTKAGDDPSEIFAFRDYQEGDRVSRIHWKLSLKNENLLVKELGMPIADRLLFLLDLNGAGEEIDTLLDVFATFSAFLAQNQAAHRVGFRDKDGFSLLEVLREDDAFLVLDRLLSTKSAPLAGSLQNAELPLGITHALYFCCRADNDVLFRLRQMPSARVSVLYSGENEKKLPAGMEALALLPDRLPEDLNGFQI